MVLASLQGNYSFNRFLTFTSLIQMDTSETQAVSANLRLRYSLAACAPVRNRTQSLLIFTDRA